MIVASGEDTNIRLRSRSGEPGAEALAARRRVVPVRNADKPQAGDFQYIGI
jgi:hypothetical protein